MSSSDDAGEQRPPEVRVDDAFRQGKFSTPSLVKLSNLSASAITCLRGGYPLTRTLS